MNCPKCDEECYRDEVDVEVGIIYGPYGCPGCGWSESPEYDHSEQYPCQKQREEMPDWYVDQWGGAIKKSAMKDRIANLGLNPDVIDDVF
jgi:hypothetical protein